MTKQQRKKGKYVFTLMNVDVPKINNTYKFETLKEKLSDIIDNSNNTTKISELDMTKGTPPTLSFLDESKSTHVCHISMIDFMSRMNVNLLRYHCYWCRHPFDSRPIGCPINYVPSHAEKKYYSCISRDTYTIKENVTSNRRKDLKNNNSIKSNICLQIGEYYETDGVFCSFNCCKSWINDNKHNRLYDSSNMLLMKMYNQIMDTKTVIIPPAPNWRILEQYGGHVNIIKFREDFNKIGYEYHGNTKLVPKFISLGTLFEEKIKF